MKALGLDERAHLYVYFSTFEPAYPEHELIKEG